MPSGTSGATAIELFGQPKGQVVRFRVGGAASIEKGDLLWFYDGDGQKRASGATVTEVAKPFAGIAAEEKEADDGATDIGVWTKGTFDVYTNNAGDVLTGDAVMMSGSNLVCRRPDADAASGAYVVGYAMEDASAAEKILVKVGW